MLSRCLAGACGRAAQRLACGVLLLLSQIAHAADGQSATVKTAILSIPDSKSDAPSFKRIACTPSAEADATIQAGLANIGLKAEPELLFDLSGEEAARAAGWRVHARAGLGGLHSGFGNEGSAPAAEPNRKVAAKFAAAYRSLVKLTALMRLPEIKDSVRLVGAVSTYNPFREGCEEGDAQTASGERYDPAAWTAAVQTELRGKFGGVRYGKLYQPVYALVESEEKQVIVKINDVGPLKPGRVLDLNERSMRYFDPFLTRGVIDNVRITLLPGEDWTPGPVGGAHLIDLAGSLD